MVDLSANFALSAQILRTVQSGGALLTDRRSRA
jgi:hypothetical protein